MFNNPLTTPANLPTEVVTALTKSRPEQLQDVAAYAEVLAKYKERKARLKVDANKDERGRRAAG